MHRLPPLLLLLACGAPADKADSPRDTATDTDVGDPTSTTPPTIPAAPVLALAPEAPDTTDTLTAAATSAHPVRWSWTVDRADAGIDGPEVSPDATARGQTWEVTAVATGPDGDSPPATAAVTIGNAAPVGDVAIDGTWTEDDLVATPAGSDPDGDAVTWTWSWTVDGADAGVDGPTVPADRTAPNQVWVVTAVPSDGTVDGTAAVAEVTVGDRPPTVEVTLYPESPTASSTLRVVADAADPDGLPVTLAYAWTIDDVLVGDGTELVGVFARDDEVVVTATASDGVQEASVEARTVIGNTPPDATSVRITPGWPLTDEDVACEAEGSDPDGDDLTWTYAWTVEGREVGDDGPSLSADNYVKGETIVCTATPSDGAVEGAPLAGDTYVRNSPPTLSEAWVVPARPATTDVVSVETAPPEDPDPADVLEVSWSWSVDGVPAPGMELTPDRFEAGSRLLAAVTVSDGTGVSAPVIAEAFVNFPPSVDLELPGSVLPDEVVAAEWAVSDADGDDVTVAWSWTVNGDPVLADGGVLDTPLVAGDAVEVTLLADDGIESIEAKAVTEVVSPENRAPAPAEVRLTPRAPMAGDAVQCASDIPRDPDGDDVTVTLALELNGDPVAAVDWLDTTTDDVVRCIATASDGRLATPSEASVVVGAPRDDNVLILIGDDMGTDRVAVYDEFPDPPRTPNLDALAGEGVLFRNAYASTVCSPTRAQIFSGRHARRTGLGSVIRPHDSDYAFPLDEHLLPEMARGVGWSSALVGKWHLVGFLADEPGLHPLTSGFDHHYGTLANPDQTLEADDVGGYYEWEYWTDGHRGTERDYLTTVNVDDALMFAETLPEPWVIVVAFNAPHAPYEAPPDELLSEPYDPDGPYWTIFDVMIEAMDTEIGRLLDGIDRDDTLVVFAGDNGTPVEFVREPWNPLHAKGSIFEAAINVPLIVAGPDVAAPGSESDALVHLVDLFGTTQHVAGVPRRDLPNETDGLSLLPYLLDPDLPSQRATVPSEWFSPNDPPGDPASEMLAVRDDRYKYVRLWDEGFGIEAERLHDMLGVDHDGADLLDGPLTPDEVDAHARLSAAADAHQELR